MGGSLPALDNPLSCSQAPLDHGRGELSLGTNCLVWTSRRAFGAALSHEMAGHTEVYRPRSLPCIAHHADTWMRIPLQLIGRTSSGRCRPNLQLAFELGLGLVRPRLGGGRLPPSNVGQVLGGKACVERNITDLLRKRPGTSLEHRQPRRSWENRGWRFRNGNYSGQAKAIHQCSDCSACGGRLEYDMDPRTTRGTWHRHKMATFPT